MTEDKHIKIYQSQIDENYTVHIIYKESPAYNDIKKSLDEIESVGALWVGTKNIYIDGESITDNNIDKDQILALEAHEIAHSLLGHQAGRDSQSEIEANLFAISLLDMDGYERASEYLKEKLKQDSGVDYEDFETEFSQDFDITEEELAKWESMLNDTSVESEESNK
jgi:GTPase Era involved in 16S rRNA processing